MFIGGAFFLRRAMERLASVLGEPVFRVRLGAGPVWLIKVVPIREVA